jgi:predicted ribosome quality control (RQC) complex YloA/Tae2 family protein
VIRLNFEGCAMYFFIRGKYTNAVLITSERMIFPFKKSEEPDEDLLIKELSEIKFSNEFSYPAFVIKEEDTPDSIRKRYPYIGKEIIFELKNRTEGKKQDLDEELNNILREVEKNNPAVFYSDKFDTLELGIESFGSIPFSEKTVFQTTSEALQYYLGRKYSIEGIADIKKKIVRYVKREMEKLSTKLNSLDSILSKESKEEIYNKYGNLLLINLHKIKPRMDKVLVDDVYEGKEIEIPINPSISPNRNADLYFERAKDDRITREKAKGMKVRFILEFNKLKGINDRIDSIEEKEELRAIMKDLKIKDDENNPVKEDMKNKFKRYIIDGKYLVFVGKDSQNNDLLTVKFAKQNDYWFHSRGVPGSHVVLRTENIKENMPKNILKKAAALAAYHSKAKTAGLTPVSYTQKKYVVKKRGMEPGKVALLKEEVLLVRPEIPPGCEYISE